MRMCRSRLPDFLPAVILRAPLPPKRLPAQGMGLVRSLIRAAELLAGQVSLLPVQEHLGADRFRGTQFFGWRLGHGILPEENSNEEVTRRNLAGCFRHSVPCS
jgi:hypothetical protein